MTPITNNRQSHQLRWLAVPAVAILALATIFAVTSLSGDKMTEKQPADKTAIGSDAGDDMSDKIQKTDEEWREKLTAEQYRITREGGTERAFTGKYWDHKEEGVYKCVACGNELFSSETKFESGSGWPSFYKPLEAENVGEKEDNSLFMTRTEVVCNRCGAHLGHVFTDGPQPTGLRYCVNSAALDFEKADQDGDGEAETDK